MIPLRDENPSYSTPWVNYALIAINVLVFLYEISLGQHALLHFLASYAVVPRHLLGAVGQVEHGHAVAPSAFVPVVTSMFMHAGWLHIAGNMLFLWIFGDNVEDRMGHVPYACFYLLAGIVAAVAQALSAPMSTLPSLGASGAIGGVLGAYIVLYPAARVFTLIFLGIFITTARIPAWVFLGIWFVLQSVQGLLTVGARTANQGGVAFWAHIGGFLFGLAVGFVLKALPPPKPQRSPFADRWYSNR
ncbi:MAG TPA: rhomboid family intramembrane serine protease [Oscillatoriaceae cyanobacterium]